MDNLPAENEPLDRETILAIELFRNNGNVLQAGLTAGYSKTYVKSGQFYNKVKSPTFHEKLKEIAISYDFQHLPLIYALEQKALSAALNQANQDENTSIENIAKLKHIATQKKKIAGIISEAPATQSQVTINVQEIRVLHGQLIPSGGNNTGNNGITE